MADQQSDPSRRLPGPPPVQAALVEVVIEIPRGSFLKRGSTDRLDFLSPLPCPFNYGSVRGYVSDDDDWLDALVLGPRLARGTRVRVRAYGAIGFTDRGIYDDKLVCAKVPPGERGRTAVTAFFHLYAAAKWVLNRTRGRAGRTACEGWTDAAAAIARTTRVHASGLPRPAVPF